MTSDQTESLRQTGDANNEMIRVEAITATDALCAILRRAPGVFQFAQAASICQVPTQQNDDEDPPTAPVEHLTGQAGIDAAIRTLTSIEYASDQHPMATRRAPGIVCFDRDISDYVAEVNQAKRELRDAMSRLGSSAWRQWQTRIPSWMHLNRLQAYREWHWLDESVDMLGLSWAGHTTNTEHLRVAALLSRLADEYKISGHPGVANDIDRLQDYDPDEVVVIRRPIAPTPMLNVRFASGQRKPIKAATPLLVAGPMPKVKPLRDFVVEDERSKVRSDRHVEPEPLISYLHVYRLQPAYRFHLRFDPVEARVDVRDDDLRVRFPKRRKVFSIPHPEPARRARIASPEPGPLSPAVDFAADGNLQLVARNRSYGYIQTPDECWRVPVKDLARIVPS